MSEASPRERRPGRDAHVFLAQAMHPADASFQGNIHGGLIMRLIDEAAGLAAYRFCRRRVVTAHIDSIDFHHPVHIGDVVMLKASVNYAGRTSMEIGVRVEAENLFTGEVIHTNSAYLVFVALDDQGRPTEVPELVPGTDEERRRYDAAKGRRARRGTVRG
jgi:acyl-CoA hydrolase